MLPAIPVERTATEKSFEIEYADMMYTGALALQPPLSRIVPSGQLVIVVLPAPAASGIAPPFDL